MTARGVINIFMAIVVVAGITSIIMRPNSANVINAISSLFTNSLRTAQGR